VVVVRVGLVDFVARLVDPVVGLFAEVFAHGDGLVHWVVIVDEI